MFPANNNPTLQNTSHKVVLPFYLYAAVAFLISTIFLLSFSSAFTGHYFHPKILAITHTMSLGWGTMIILGASHQLIPVLVESKLYSNNLAYLSFVLAAIGIPLLVYGFYTFNLGWPARYGGCLVVLSIVFFVVNIATGMSKSKQENVHAVFVFTASVWLLLTAILGLAQVYNFTSNILPADSLHYLSLHAHAGIVGWFLLLAIGVASRLLPMFLISKYSNTRLLWWIYCLVNTSLLGFLLLFLYSDNTIILLLPVIAVFIAIALFIFYCYEAYKKRIRKQVDEQMKLSLLSVLMVILPLILLIAVIIFLLQSSAEKFNLILSYGFLIFFGWLTALILAMTFKTLPFIVWNKIYHRSAGLGKTPNPKDLFNNGLFKAMSIAYIGGLAMFTSGILLTKIILLNAGAVLMLLTAVLYTLNVLKVITHKPGEL